MPLDIEQPGVLVDYLRGCGRLSGAVAPCVSMLAGGVSNRTMLVEHADGTAWVVKQALPRLRVASEWLSDPARIEREALALRWMPTILGAECVPGFVFEDKVNHILAMSAVPQPHSNWKSLLLAGEVSAAMVRSFGAMLGRLHARGRGREAAVVFGDRSFFSALRVEPYYWFTASRHPSTQAFYEALVEETLATRECLVHGDYSPKNTLVRMGQMVLLDYEVMHWGDPAFDLGFALAHFLSKAGHVPGRRELFNEVVLWFWEAYAKALGEVSPGVGFEARVVRHALGCLLARVDGRSPLEYLSEGEREVQRRASMDAMGTPPVTVAELAGRWHAALKG